MELRFLNQLTLNRDIILDFLGGPTVTQRLLKVEEGGRS